jgi:RimJ/RimL family protein N-acetyltransferase
MIFLKDVSYFDYEFLYDLLLERDPIANISHKKMPTYAEHLKFWGLRPYSYAAIIMRSMRGFENSQQIGLIYLTGKNEIGINVKKEYRRKGYGAESLKLLINKFSATSRPYYANISPKNDVSKMFFSKFGFKELQHTYIYEEAYDKV